MLIGKGNLHHKFWPSILNSSREITLLTNIYIDLKSTFATIKVTILIACNFGDSLLVNFLISAKSEVNLCLSTTVLKSNLH